MPFFLWTVSWLVYTGSLVFSLNQTGTGQAEPAPRGLPFEKGVACEVFPSCPGNLNHEFSNTISIRAFSSPLTEKKSSGSGPESVAESGTDTTNQPAQEGTQKDQTGMKQIQADKTTDVTAQTNSKEQGLIHLEVEKYSLKNGLTVLLHEDPRVPQVYHQLMIKTGSKDEVEGKTGLAHLFEHMMFRGTKKYTGEEYEEKLESMGARNNAWTNRDLTAYHVLLPSHELKTVLKMEAERLNSLQLNQKNLNKEIEVVKEERRMRTDNNPNEFLEPLMKLIFPSHPYGRPIIGWMKDLETMTLTDCQKFYQTHYAPNNAILTLAGHFDSKKAKKWIQKYYGALKPSELPPAVTHKVSAQTQPRNIRIKRAIHAPTLVLAYRGPKAGDKKYYPLDVLNQVLTRGESSRLHKLLVYRHKLALSVGGFYYDMKDEGIFLVVVKMTPTGDLNKAQKLIMAEIQKARTSDISEKERLKSARMIMNDYVSAVKSLSGKANSLSHYTAYFGDHRQLFHSLSEYENVTAESIRENARLYLNDKKVSVVQLVPEKIL